MIEQYLLTNTHRSIIRHAPDADLLARQEAEEKARLAKIRSGLGDNELQQIAAKRTRSPSPIGLHGILVGLNVAKANELITILRDLLLSARLDQRERVRRIVLEEKARLESSLVPAGSYYCSLRLKAGANVSGFANEQCDWPRIAFLQRP